MKTLPSTILSLAVLLAGCAAPQPPSPTDQPASPTTQVLTPTTGMTEPRPSPTPPAAATTPLETAAPTVTETQTNSAEQPAAGFPPQPDGVPWPTNSWPTGELPEWVDAAAVDRAVETALAGGFSLRVRAVVIIYQGKLAYEAYSPHNADSAAALMPGHSIAKSFTSALIGILVKQGRLDVSAPAPVPEWSAEDDTRGVITLDHLLTMSSGLEWHEERYPEESDMTAMFAAGDAAAYVAAKPLEFEPGTQFEYNSGGTTLLSRIAADQVGSGDAFERFMKDELLSKIGIYRYQLAFDPRGTWLGSYALDTTAREFAKFGLLYLRGGIWDGERILPDGWVEYTRTPSAANPGYGAHWWLDPARPGEFYAVGTAGQAITVAPALDLVLVELATDAQVSYELSEVILAEFDKRPRS